MVEGGEIGFRFFEEDEGEGTAVPVDKELAARALMEEEEADREWDGDKCGIELEEVEEDSAEWGIEVDSKLREAGSGIGTVGRGIGWRAGRLGRALEPELGEASIKVLLLLDMGSSIASASAEVHAEFGTNSPGLVALL